MNKIRLILTAALLIIGAMPAYSVTAEEALANFRSRMYGIGSLSGVISWSYETDIQYTAAFKYMPGKIYVKFSNPSGKVIVCNGRKLWIYNPASNICGIQDVGGGSSGGIGGLLSGYMGIVTSQGSGGYTLKLKKADAHYREVILSLDQSFFLKRAVLKDVNGKSLRFTVNNIDSGAVLKSHFEFNVPANAQIIKNPLEIK